MTIPISTIFSVQKFCALPSFAGFTVSGDDANTFLQGQLTNDVAALANQTSQRTGYCTPKGRLMATFLQWRIGPNALGHLLPAELFETTTKRLRMFVLRAKVTFSPPEATLGVFGLWGRLTSDGQRLIAGLGEKAAAGVIDFGQIAHEKNEKNGPSTGPWLILESPCPVLGQRAWLVAHQADRDSIAQGLQSAQSLPEAAWAFSEIQNAKPWVWEKTKEAFVPQMINFELVNGVSFTKGCYPGQEVVARSQYLGKLKRRSFRADLEIAPQPCSQWIGADVWSSAIPHEPCGQVVDCAPNFNASGAATSGACLLLECTLDAWGHGGLHVGAIDGPLLRPMTLPYSFPAAA
jgi:hypothetical protein